MKSIYILLFASLSHLAISQEALYPYEPSAESPFGLPNPKAPPEILDFAPLIGECECYSVSRNADQTWSDSIPMSWRFRYIMNGMAVQDETLKSDGKHSGSIRQYNPDSAAWFVHYYSSTSPTSSLSTWRGGKTANEDIVLYREQSAPNGTEGYYRLTFSQIKNEHFNWVGEWVNLAETFQFPTWKIHCKKKKGNKE